MRSDGLLLRNRGSRPTAEEIRSPTAANDALSGRRKSQLSLGPSIYVVLHLCAQTYESVGSPVPVGFNSSCPKDAQKRKSISEIGRSASAVVADGASTACAMAPNGHG